MMELPQSRLDSLYRDFRHLEELNPEGYKANIETWKKFLIKKYLERPQSFLFQCGAKLLRDLSRESHGAPGSIDLVLNSLIESDYLVTADDFYRGMMYPQDGSFILRWIGLSGRKRSSFDVRKNNDTYYLKETELVIRHAIEEKFEQVNKRITSNIISHATGVTDLIFTKQQFYAKSGMTELLVDSEQEREAMLFYLSHYKKLIVSDVDVIKVIAPDVVHILADFPRTVTQDDHRVAFLKATSSNVDLQVKQLTEQVTSYTSKLRKAITDSQPKEIQRNYLQGKKMAEKNLSRLLAYQNNLLRVKSQLDMAATNQLLVSTLKDSSKLLTSINEYTGSVERVEELLDEMKEQGERTEAVSELLASSGIAEEDVELDEELDKMEEEERQKTTKETASDERKENIKAGESSESLLRELNDLNINDEKPPGELRQKEPKLALREQRNAVIGS